MLTRIISALLSLLLSIFPFFQRTKPLDNETVANIVISAVQNRDDESLKALEDIMCLNIKQNTDDLPAEIIEFVNCIEGDVTEISWERVGAYSESDGNGKYIQQNGQSFIFSTTGGQYGITLQLETYNSFSPEEMGIRSISIFTCTYTLTPNGIENYSYGSHLYKIRATEGVQEWHS